MEIRHKKMWVQIFVDFLSQINTCFSSKLIFLSKNIIFLVKMQLQVNMILVGSSINSNNGLTEIKCVRNIT